MAFGLHPGDMNKALVALKGKNQMLHVNEHSSKRLLGRVHQPCINVAVYVDIIYYQQLLITQNLKGTGGKREFGVGMRKP